MTLVGAAAHRAPHGVQHHFQRVRGPFVAGPRQTVKRPRVRVNEQRFAQQGATALGAEAAKGRAGRGIEVGRLGAEREAVAGRLHAKALEGFDVCSGDAIIVDGLSLGVYGDNAVGGVGLPRAWVQNGTVGLKGSGNSTRIG